ARGARGFHPPSRRDAADRERRLPPEPALRRRARRGSGAREAAPALPERGLRAGVRRVPAVPARRAGRRPPDARVAAGAGGVRRARRPRAPPRRPGSAGALLLITV